MLIGSANFSDESCRQNDENALLIEGDERLAAIMATELIRMFDHYKSRSFINQFFSDSRQSEHFLKDTGVWSTVYFNSSSRSHKFRDREVFSGHG